jgi:hypothetical protein
MDTQGIRNMILISGVMLQALEAQIEDIDPDEAYYLKEAKGNLGQFIEELEKALANAPADV